MEKSNKKQNRKKEEKIRFSFEKMTELLDHWKELNRKNELSCQDFVGSFILLWISYTSQNISIITGRLKKNISDAPNFDSIKINNLPGCEDFLGIKTIKWLDKEETIISLFNKFR